MKNKLQNIENNRYCYLISYFKIGNNIPIRQHLATPKESEASFKTGLSIYGADYFKKSEIDSCNVGNDMAFMLNK